MNKNQKNNENTLLANTKGQPLKEHSIAIALYGHLLLKSLKFKSDKEEKINKYLIYSSLLHDIGKVSDNFQNHIKKKSNNNDSIELPTDAESSRPKTFKGPFHNEISWAYIANFIGFQNEKIEDTVQHSVYWHHSANWCDEKNKIRFENSKDIFESVKESQIANQIYKFICDLFCSFSTYLKINCPPDLEDPNQKNVKRFQYPEFFKHKMDSVIDNACKQLCLNLLLESDRTVSSWSLEELQGFLNDWKNFKTNSHKREKPILLENLNNNPKSKEQNDLAQKMSDKKLSVCGVDPAGGKTSIALYWWHHCHNEYPLMIALPRQHQITGLFKSLEEDSQRVYGDQKIKIEGVFNGQRQHCNWNPEEEEDFLILDINIMVFDRFLSPYYKRSQSSEFVKMLRSHLVLDEFHEFKDIPKMIPSLKEVLTIRSWLDSGVKTLMLSGTPEPSLLKLININIEDKFVFKRDELSSREGHKFKISAQEKEIEDIKEFIPDCLYSFLRVESCQEVFSRLFKTYKDQIKMIHTYFTTEDKKELLENILKEHGQKTAYISQNSVITSKMLQSSYNLSFDKALVELSQPHTDCQTAGRINRFENKPDAEIHFIYNEESENFFDERKADFKKIHQNWKKHFLSFIIDQDNKAISIRKLMQVYDTFWSKENIEISLGVLKKQQKKAIEELNKYIPKRFSLGKNKKASSQVFNSLFRGESRLLSACVVDDKGRLQNQLRDEDLLNESRIWFIKKIEEAMSTCLKTISKCNKANKINDQEVFEYNRYIKTFGFKTERPLLCSHFDKEINECFKKALFDEDSGKTTHRVYHKKFGLVKKETLNKIFKK